MSTTALLMLVFVTPPDVRSSFKIPPELRRRIGVTYRPETTAQISGVEHGNTAAARAALPGIERTLHARTRGNAA
jgi:hypothetical protein